MRRLAIMLGVAATTMSACEAQNSGLIPIRVMDNAGTFTPGAGCSITQATCLYEGGGITSPVNIVFDTGFMRSLVLPMEFQNDLKGGTIEFGTGERGVDLRIPHEVTPQRMEIRWECETRSLSSDVGPLLVPRFHPTLPFCLDRRQDIQEFVGFDVVPAQGNPINPQGRGIVTANVVPYQVGLAWDETLDIAQLADACCRADNTKCDGSNSNFPQCQNLQRIFESVAPGQFKVESDTPGTPSPDLLRFRGFSIFDGSYLLTVRSETANMTFSPSYLMRLRGVLEGQTTVGDTVVSSEVVTSIQLCRNCGPVASPVKRCPQYDRNNICMGALE